MLGPLAPIFQDAVRLRFLTVSAGEAFISTITESLAAVSTGTVTRSVGIKVAAPGSLVIVGEDFFEVMASTELAGLLASALAAFAVLEDNT
jgi:isocitrate dehydrogenase